MLKTESERTRPSTGLIFMVAVVLPFAIVLIDHWALGLGSSESVMRVFYPLLVVQVALLGWSVGRFVEPAPLRWVVFTWTIALMDLQAFTLMYSYGDTGKVLGYALFASQVGMLVLWSILGPPPWPRRLSATLVALAAILAFLSVINYWEIRSWPPILLTHSAIFITICFFLRRIGFQLEKMHRFNPLQKGMETKDILRFSIKDLLLWTTALAPLVLAAKGLDIVLFSHLKIGDIYPVTLLAVILALTSLLGVWVPLGTGNTLVRVLIAIVGGLLLGFVLHHQAHYWHVQFQLRTPIGRWWGQGVSQTSRTFVDLRDIWVYLIQMELWLLAAMLMFLRASGYQLLRVKRQNSNLSSSIFCP